MRDGRGGESPVAPRGTRWKSVDAKTRGWKRGRNLGNRLAGFGMAPVAREPSEWLENEGSLRHPRVRYPKARFLDHPFSIEQKVQIQLARPEARAARAPPGVPFERLEESQQVAGRQPRLADAAGVQEGRLILHVHGVRNVNRRATLLEHPGAYSVERGLDVSQPVPEVRSDPDRDGNPDGATIHVSIKENGSLRRQRLPLGGAGRVATELDVREHVDAVVAQHTTRAPPVDHRTYETLR